MGRHGRRRLGAIRKMPIGLQIYLLKRRFEKLNPSAHASGSIGEDGRYPEVDWWYVIDKTLEYDENLDTFELEYPQYVWRLPRAPEDKSVWKERYDEESKCFVYSRRVVIGPHKVKSKSKTYLHGRIQVTVDKKWIGLKATISVRVPV